MQQRAIMIENLLLTCSTFLKYLLNGEYKASKQYKVLIEASNGPLTLNKSENGTQINYARKFILSSRSFENFHSTFIAVATEKFFGCFCKANVNAYKALLKLLFFSCRNSCLKFLQIHTLNVFLFLLDWEVYQKIRLMIVFKTKIL